MITFKQDSGNTWKRRNSKYVVVLKTPGNADICVCLRHMATWDDGKVRVGDQRDSKNFAIARKDCPLCVSEYEVSRTFDIALHQRDLHQRGVENISDLPPLPLPLDPPFVPLPRFVVRASWRRYFAYYVSGKGLTDAFVSVVVHWNDIIGKIKKEKQAGD